MGLIHFEGLYEIIYLFDKCVLGREILRVFLWTHEMQEYTLFDFVSEIIIINLYIDGNVSKPPISVFT